jgi:hypothetical protein
MPHRIPTSLAHVFEFFALAVAAIVAQINALLDETSWDRLTGRHGALFFMAIALLIFWNSNRVAEKRRLEHLAKLDAKEDNRRIQEEKARQAENDAREARHREALAVQHHNAQKLIELTVEGIKAQGMVATALVDLKKVLDSRPCGVGRPSFSELPILTHTEPNP